ncbi:DinB family protein [Actinocorallia lasiicapitis]
MKCEGLGGEELRRRAVEPSGLSLLGLVRHVAEVERDWFRNDFAGEGAARLWGDGGGLEWDVDGADVDEAFAAWRAEIAYADEVIGGTELGATGRTPDGQVFSLRWLVCHMIEEYARHNGHADLLRERIDGRTGE